MESKKAKDSCEPWLRKSTSTSQKRRRKHAMLFQSLGKQRSNSKLHYIIVTNISRPSTHTTSWFTEVRHQHLKANLRELLSHVLILIVSKSNLQLEVFGLFRVLFALWSLIILIRRASKLHEYPQSIPFSSLFRKYDKKGDEPAGARWKHQNGAERANFGKILITFANAQKMPLCCDLLLQYKIKR